MGEGIRKMKAFYSALLSRLRADDHEKFLLELGSRSLFDPRPRHRGRSFLYRVAEFLLEKTTDEFESIRDLLDAEGDIFSVGSAEHELHSLLRGYDAALESVQVSEPRDNDKQAPDSEEWGKCLSRLRILIDDFKAPSINSAEAITEAANKLLEACRTHEDVASKEIGEEYRAEIRAALEAVVSDRSTDHFIDGIENCDLDTLRALQPLASKLSELAKKRANIREKNSHR